jgi:hypothetical protein
MKFLILLLCAASAMAAPTLTWDPNSESNLAGYRVHVGRLSRQYTTNFSTTNTVFTFTNLATIIPDASRYFFAVTAFDTDGLENEYSDEVSWTAGATLRKVTGFRVKIFTVQSAPSVLGPWTDEGQLAFDLAAPRFFRLAIGAPPPPEAPASKRLEPTSGSKTGKLPLMIPKRPVQGPPFPPG